MRVDSGSTHRRSAGVPQSSRGIRMGGERRVACFGFEFAEEASDRGERRGFVRALQEEECSDGGGVARCALSEARCARFVRRLPARAGLTLDVERATEKGP